MSNPSAVEQHIEQRYLLYEFICYLSNFSVFGYQSKYDLRDITSTNRINLCTHHYQCLHADLLYSLYLQNGDQTFLRLYERTEQQLNNRSTLAKVYLNKFSSLILKR